MRIQCVTEKRLKTEIKSLVVSLLTQTCTCAVFADSGFQDKKEKILTVFVLHVDWRSWMDGWSHTSVREQVCIRFAGPRKRRK